MKLVTNSWLDISVRAVGGGSDCAGATLDVGRTDIGFDGAIDGVLWEGGKLTVCWIVAA